LVDRLPPISQLPSEARESGNRRSAPAAAACTAASRQPASTVSVLLAVSISRMRFRRERLMTTACAVVQRRGAADQAGVAALRHHRDAFLRAQRDHRGDLLGIEVVHVAVGNAHAGEFADFEVFAVRDVHQAVDFRRVGLAAGDSALLVDLLDQHLDLAADPAFEALRADVLLQLHQALPALFAQFLFGTGSGSLLASAPSTGE
jgi:hypothetical protein